MLEVSKVPDDETRKQESSTEVKPANKEAPDAEASADIRSKKNRPRRRLAD